MGNDHHHYHYQTVQAPMSLSSRVQEANLTAQLQRQRQSAKQKQKQDEEQSNKRIAKILQEKQVEKVQHEQQLQTLKNEYQKKLKESANLLLQNNVAQKFQMMNKMEQLLMKGLNNGMFQPSSIHQSETSMKVMIKDLTGVCDQQTLQANRLTKQEYQNSTKKQDEVFGYADISKEKEFQIQFPFAKQDRDNMKNEKGQFKGPNMVVTKENVGKIMSKFT